MKQHNNRTSRPQVIDVRKPLRPVHVAATRRPIKVTKPITFGDATIPARLTR